MAAIISVGRFGKTSNPIMALSGRPLFRQARDSQETHITASPLKWGEEGAWEEGAWEEPGEEEPGRNRAWQE